MAEAAAAPVVEQTDADFDKLFREAADAAQKGTEPAAVEPPPPTAKSDAVPPAGEVTPPPEIPAKTAEELAAEKTAADAQKAVDDAAAAAKAVTDGAAQILADKETARIAAEAAARPAEETSEAKAAREAFEASIAPYDPTDAEKEALAKFQKEFPEEYVAVEARFKALDKTVNSRVAKAVESVLQQINGVKDSIAPLAQDVNQGAFERHITAVKAAHSDFDTVSPLLPAWIKTQPAYLQGALQSVYDKGSTADVISLVASYKAAAGVVTQVAAPVVKTPADADDLAPVGTQRVTPTPKGAPDPNDYEAAFAEAAAAAK